ncbi:TPA: 50S ribosomal protein L11 methyltransferase [Klebsiella pneumoniae]|nr:50S ribosomal protein L11 methyltransferase [Klebsiella pneumoniae]
MPWIQLKLNTTGANAEDLSDALMEAGSVSITFQDTHDTPVFEPLPGETRLWGDTDVIGLFDAETDMKAVVAQLEQHPLLGAGFAHKIEQLEDKDWEREWMDNFHPMRFGERLWICPSWRDVPDENAVNVMLDPGLAFGTGTHPTTSLCLQWLDGLDLNGKTVIDFGCGSGILAIAALKLGAAKAIGIDIDPQAIQASRDNAQRNGVSERLELYLPQDQPESMKADVVVANILAGPLRELAPLISVLPVSGGLLGLSGILASQAESVCEAYADLFALDPVVEKEECGIQALTIHGRTRACLFNGDAEYDSIRAVKQKVSIPIIANGDITDPLKARAVLDYTGADALMIGRAAQGRPWIFREIQHYLDTGELLPPLPLAEVKRLLCAHVRELHDFYGQAKGYRIARKHVSWYLQEHAPDDQFRRTFNAIEDASEQLEALEAYFENFA